MQKFKQFVCVALVFALCFGIVGCGAQPQVQLSNQSSSAAKPTAPIQEQTGSGEKEPEYAPSSPTDSSEKEAQSANNESIGSVSASPEGSTGEQVQVPESNTGASTGETNSEAESVVSLGSSATQQLPSEEPAREDLEEILDLITGTDTSSEEVSDLDNEELEDLIVDLLENSIGTPPHSGSTVSGTFDSDNVTDEGTLELPFDQLYPELMEQVEYSDETLTLKLTQASGGEISDAMKQAGVAALEYLFSVDDASWYEAKLTSGTDTANAVELLRGLDEVLVADYNYAAHAHGMAQAEGIDDAISGNAKVNEQWYMEHCGITSGQDRLTNPGGSSSVVVAVIDTGVDYTHEDLSQNIWVNQNEIDGNGIDDDSNGYVDDYYGVNVITQQGNGNDDNGHGTHVAGIIAAQNNNLGTVGIAYNVKIMPIKALNHEGVTNDTDIIKAVLYAVNHGAEVINMSFGQEAMSLSVQEALAMAYNQCVLVASAGNDGAANEGDDAIPNYPAALPYVIGVMSVNKDGKESSFSSYDVKPYNGIEYELYAPGEGILSTIPGNRYASWSGTSMAAPVVAAMAALLRSEYPNHETHDTKFIYGQLVSTSEHFADCFGHGDHSKAPIVNLYQALAKLPKPNLGMSSYDLFDTKEMNGSTVNNGDGVVDTGETLALGLTLRNRWGASGKTTVTISAGDDRYVSIENPTVDYGGIGTYSTADCGKIYTNEMLTGWEDPFYITVSEECPGNHVIRLDITISSTNGLNPLDDVIYTENTTIYLQVRNGTLLPTVIDEDMTLKGGNLYIISNATIINEGVTVTAEPGAQIQFWSSDREDPYADQYMVSLRVAGRLLVEGTEENPVLIFPGEVLSSYAAAAEDGNTQLSNNYAVNIAATGNGIVSLIYADVTNLCNANYQNEITYAYGSAFHATSDYLNYRYLSSGTVQSTSNSLELGTIKQAENCVFYKLNCSDYNYLYGSAENCAFVDCSLNLSQMNTNSCLFLGNNYVRTNTYKEYDHINGGYKEVTNYSYYNSSYNAHGVSSTFGDYESSDNLKVYYRPETGTTYLAYYGSFSTPQLLLYAKELGGNYAVMDDESEMNWIMSNVRPAEGSEHNVYDLGVEYDFLTKCYRWGDGSELGEFMQVEGVTDTLSAVDLLWNGSSLTPDTSDGMYSGYLLLEIPGPIYITDIRLTEYNVLVDMESTYQILYSTSPVNVPAEQLIFESDNEEVATVDTLGNVTPVSEGDANIYVYCADRAVSNYVTVHVREYRALEEIHFAEESMEVALGQEGETKLLFTPVNTTRKNVTYSSSDESIATVDRQGRVTPVSSGTVTITATFAQEYPEENYLTASMDVTVYRQATSMSLSEDALLAVPDSAVTLPELTVLPQGAEPVLTWRSTDPEVAAFNEDGELIVTSCGITTVVVTDRRSGLSASFLLVVTEAENLHAITDMQISDSSHTVLTENGDLYYWGSSSKAPVKVLSDVKKYHQYSDTVFALMSDGTLLYAGLYDLLNWDDYYNNYKYDCEIQNIVDLQYFTTRYFLTEEGRVYFWDSENSKYKVVNITEQVVQMTTSYEHCYFLTDTGTLYHALEGETTANVITTEQPVAYIPTMHTWSDGEYLYYLTKDGALWYYSINNGHSQRKKTPTDLENVILAGSDSCYYIDDGMLYKVVADAGYAYHLEKIEGIENVAHIAQYSNTYFAYTTDGLIYGWGSNSNANSNHFAGITTEAYIDAPTMLPLFPVENNFRITSSNLINNTLLIEEKLELEFSNAIKSYSATLYEDGLQVPVGVEIHDENHMTLYTGSGFLADKTYTLTFEPNDITAGYGQTNTETITLDFTAQLKQTANEVVMTKDSEPAQPDVLNVTDWDTLELSWYVTDESVAVIEDNLLVPKNPGVTTVRLTERKSGLVCDFDVTVQDVVIVDVVDEKTNETIQVPTYPVPEEVLVVESLNLIDPDSENAALCDPALVLNFNKKLLSNEIVYPVEEGSEEPPVIQSGIQLCVLGDDGEWIEVETAQVNLAEFDIERAPDELVITPVEGFVEDAHYAVFLNGTFLTGLNAQPSMWVISYEFIFDPVEIIDTTIVRSAVLDESIERFYWTRDNFRSRVNELHETLNLNYTFINNVILNRVSTDTNVDHWMRVFAPQSEDSTIPLGGNYWGTADENVVNLQILDHSDFSTYATILSSPFLTEGPEINYPFVTDLAILDKSGNEVTHLSNEQITVRITFNRDMDTTAALEVSFGNNYPYDQYKISGEFVDERTWEGSYILTTILENGNHCFSIGGGRSAEGMELFTDWGRFGFELDTAAAQALLMQAEATKDGIQLSWSQDDFDTLMGYNIYRSTDSANAYTQRINSTVIPTDTKTYLDTDVEPGVVYYYSFTVVQTDLSESAPSGKVNIMSLDTMAPNLYHSPVYTATLGSNLMITATVNDNLDVSGVYVYYRVIGETEWKTAVMNRLNDKFSALISSTYVTEKGLEYYIEATDGVSSTFKGSAETPYQVKAVEASDDSSKGDVNGDGEITVLDALMLLQRINQILILDAEQFSRADLDDSGVLEAWEALRILQYVSGKIGSISLN